MAGTKKGESFFCKMIIPNNCKYFMFFYATHVLCQTKNIPFGYTDFLAIKPSHGLYCTIKKDYWKVVLSWVDKHFFLRLMTYWSYMAYIDNGSDKVMRRAEKKRTFKKSVGGKGECLQWAMKKREKLLINYMRLIIWAWAWVLRIHYAV